MEKKYAKQIHEKDNVATCVADAAKGETVYVRLGGEETPYTVNQDIKFGHKIAIKPVKTDEYVFKYGQAIGKATQPIAVGDWVHTHNIKDHYEVR